MSDRIMRGAAGATLATIAASLIGAAVLTFCAPQPAYAGYLEAKSCPKVAMAVAAVLNDEVSVEEAETIIAELTADEEELAKQASIMAYQLGMPLEKAVPLVYQHCMKEATL